MATFESLPTELQIQIWQSIFNEPRIIELGATPSHLLHRRRAKEPIDILKRIKLTTNNQRLMHPATSTNRLSRELALAYYGNLEKAQFNPATDILYFGPEFGFTPGWDTWDDLATSATSIRHFAFHLRTFRTRNDFMRLRDVCALRPKEGITFVLEAPFTRNNNDDSDAVGLFTTVAMAPHQRFMPVDHQLISTRKELRALGREFREAQIAVVRGAYENHDAGFETWGRSRVESWDDDAQVYGGGEDGLWRMPKIRFLVEDQTQAEAAREGRRCQQEVEMEKVVQEIKRRREIAIANAPPIEWGTPQMTEYEKYLYMMERC